MDKAAFGAALAAVPKAEQARWLLDLFDDLVLDNVPQDVAVEFLQGLFDKYVVPWNAPGIPDFVEKRIEAQVRDKLIPFGVGKVYEVADNDAA